MMRLLLAFAVWFICISAYGTLSTVFELPSWLAAAGGIVPVAAFLIVCFYPDKPKNRPH